MATAGHRPVWTTALVVIGSLAVVAFGLVALADRTDRTLVADDTGTADAAADATPTATATPAPTSAATPTPTGTPTGPPMGTPMGTPAPSPVPRPAPLVVVDVLNQTLVTGLAATTASVLADAGWTVGLVDNAAVGAPSSTLYVPSGLESQAEAFVEAFPAVQRTRPAFEGLRVDGLTLVLAEPDAEQVVAGLEARSLASAADVPAPVGAGP